MPTSKKNLNRISSKPSNHENQNAHMSSLFEKHAKLSHLKSSDFKKKLTSLEKKLGYHFKKQSILLEALTHKSAAHDIRRHYSLHPQHPPKTNHNVLWNERLEFLGDAVLGLAISSILMSKKEHYHEGELSKIRAVLVNETSLAKLARKIDLGSKLFLGKGEALGGGETKDSLLADALEALFGAIYLDGDFSNAKHVIEKIFSPLLKGNLKEMTSVDYKTKLQELTQEKYQTIPEYRVIEERGPAHAKSFKIIVYLNEKELGLGCGSSKKRAEQEAARTALKHLQKAKT